MADELQITLGVNFTNGKLTDTVTSSTNKVTQTTQGFHGTVVSVGTSEEDLSLGDIGTNGYVYLKNLDSANYVKYGPKSGGSMIEYGRIKAGEVAVLRLAPGITHRWIADTAAVKVLVKAYEN